MMRWSLKVLADRVRDLERKLTVTRAKLQLLAERPLGPEARRGIRQVLDATEFVRLPSDELVLPRRHRRR